MPVRKIDKEKLFDILIQAAENDDTRQKLLSNADQELASLNLSKEEEDLLAKVLPRVVYYNDLVNEVNQLKSRITGNVNPLPATETIQKEQENYLIEQLRTTSKLLIGFKEGLLDSVNQIKSGFRGVMVMYNVAFYTGIFLIIASIVYAFISNNSLISIAFAGIGMVDIIIYFILKPPLDLQKSRANLAQLESAYFNWLIDLSNWNTAVSAPDIAYERYKEISAILLNNTEKTLKIIEDYCDLSTTTAKTPKE